MGFPEKNKKNGKSKEIKKRDAVNAVLPLYIIICLIVCLVVYSVGLTEKNAPQLKILIIFSIYNYMKKRENNIIRRLGSKDNDIKFFINYLPLESKTIVEPFGGSFAVTRRVYYDDKYIKIVNDNDTTLYKIYQNPEYFCSAINQFLNIFKQPKGIENFKKCIETFNNTNIDEDIKKHITNTFIIKGYIVKQIKNLDYTEQIKFMKKIEFFNEDYKHTIERYKNDKNAFIFLDPPYLFSDNSQYRAQNEDTDMTDIIVYLLNILKDKKTKCKIMLIINKLKILQYLFKDYIKGEYNKIYQIGKKKNKHLIICNY